MKIKVKVQGQEHELEISRTGQVVRVVQDGQSWEAAVQQTEGGKITILHQGKLVHLAGVKQGDKRQLWVNGQTLTYERLQKRGSGAGAEAGSLSATIPAVVSQVLVQVGEAITAGQKLILLESMKMVIPIQAPHDGIVKEIRCAAGQSVQPGVPLVLLETA